MPLKVGITDSHAYTHLGIRMSVSLYSETDMCTLYNDNYARLLPCYGHSDIPLWRQEADSLEVISNRRPIGGKFS